jgi:hypothetical protein
MIYNKEICEFIKDYTNGPSLDQISIMLQCVAEASNGSRFVSFEDMEIISETILVLLQIGFKDIKKQKLVINKRIKDHITERDMIKILGSLYLKIPKRPVSGSKKRPKSSVVKSVHKKILLAKKKLKQDYIKTLRSRNDQDIIDKLESLHV